MSAYGPGQDVGTWGKVQKLINGAMKALSGPVVDRAGGYGEKMVSQLTSKNHASGTEGTIYCVRTPVPGTGLATIAAPTTFSGTSPFICIYNANPTAGAAPVDIILERIKLRCTAAGTAGASLQYVTQVDNIARYLSGGQGYGVSANPLLGPYPTYSGANPASAAQVQIGALVAAASSAQARVFSSDMLRSAIPVVNDSYTIHFGASDQPVDIGLISGSAIVQRNIPHEHVSIAPGHSFLLHLFLPSQSAASSFEAEVYFSER
jgi:hypothetical protein